MTRLKIFLALGAFAMLTLPGCTKSNPASSPAREAVEPTRIASVDVVKPSIERVEIPVGGAAAMTLQLSIRSGYHVNANPPTFSYLIPTELTITPSEGVSAGAISYPPPITAKLSFSEKPLAVYEGDVAIQITMQADKSAQPGERSLSAKLRIQACDDQVCYPPGTRDLTIPVTVK